MTTAETISTTEAPTAAVRSLHCEGASFYFFDDGSMLMNDNGVWDVVVCEQVQANGKTVTMHIVNGSCETVAYVDSTGTLRSLNHVAFQ